MAEIKEVGIERLLVPVSILLQHCPVLSAVRRQTWPHGVGGGGVGGEELRDTLWGCQDLEKTADFVRVSGVQI